MMKLFVKILLTLLLVYNISFASELNEKQKKIIQGAKQCLEEKFSYDVSMAYHVLTYEDKINTGKKVFPNGDLSPDIGVCTDVTVRALRYGLQLDLQKEINDDAVKNWRDYPMKRWSAKKPDSNIDHRRVPNQEVWFGKYWTNVTNEEYMPGDVIIWDMNGDGWSDHIGIISDNKINNNYTVIHNFPDPGYVAEEDVINEWKISGVYRIK
jgi:uncharacterized protein YijF (DUF1287 family)